MIPGNHRMAGDRPIYLAVSNPRPLLPAYAPPRPPLSDGSLNAAQGIMLGLTLGAAFYGAIGLVVWWAWASGACK